MCKFYSISLDALFPPVTVPKGVPVTYSSHHPESLLPAIFIPFLTSFPDILFLLCLPTVRWEYYGETVERQSRV